MTRYRVSRELDAEVDYVVSEAHHCIKTAYYCGDLTLAEDLTEELNELWDLQMDMTIDSTGFFTVSSKYYPLALMCRDAYKLRNKSGNQGHSK